jgi:hypothetical protein
LGVITGSQKNKSKIKLLKRDEVSFNIELKEWMKIVSRINRIEGIILRIHVGKIYICSPDF